MSEEVQTPVDAPVEADTATQPVEATTPASILSDDGKFSQDWVSSLPDDLGKHSIFQKYDNPIDLIKGSINAQSQVGKRAEEFWQSEADDDIQLKRQIMGIPDSVDEYNLEVPEGIIEDEADEQIFSKLKQHMFDNGLSNEQAQAVVDYQIERYKEASERAETQESYRIEEAEKALRDEWKGDKYEYNVSKVADTLDYLGLSDFKDDPNYGNNPEFIKAIFDKITPLISDDEIIRGTMSESYATVNDQLVELEQKMNDWTGNVNDPYYLGLTTQRGELLKKIS